MRTYATMLRNGLDFFIHSGDNIYADGPIAAEQKMPNGETWKNIVTADKLKPAETLPEFRGAYKYNLLDKNLRAFAAQGPVFSQWDDHEVFNNWWPGEPMTRAELVAKKNVEKNDLILAARVSRAFHEYTPMRETLTEPARVYRKISYGPLLDVFMLDMRSYRGPNAEDKEETYGAAAYFLGPTQLAWLKREFSNSRATWKVIAADMPISLVIVYDGARKWGIEGVAQGDDGSPRGRDWRLPICYCSSSTPACAIRSGSRPTFTTRPLTTTTGPRSRTSNRSGNSSADRSTPELSAPNALDKTFGPQLVYVNAPSKEQGQNLPPSEGMQFFGHIAIDGASQQMTVTLKDVYDRSLWAKILDPMPG